MVRPLAMPRFSLSDLALDRPVTTTMVLIAAFVLGLVATFRLPLSFLPAEQAQRINVRVNLQRTSPEIVEREVIRPLEEIVAGVRDLRSMRVSSGSWGVRMRLNFKPGTELDARKIELRERIDRARDKLPDDVERVSLDSSSGTADDPIMVVRIAGDDIAQSYYRIERRVVRRLERVAGVARVELEGVEPHELDVALDLEAAQRRGIELSAVGSTVRSASRGQSLGSVRTGPDQTGVRLPASPARTETFAALPIDARRGRGGTSTATTQNPNAGTAAEAATASTGVATTEARPTPARLGEVAKVRRHPREQRRVSRMNGRRAVSVNVYAAAGTSTVDVSSAIRDEIAMMQDDPQLAGIDVATFEDQGKMILETLGDLRDTGVYGGLIGVLVLFCFLHRFRTTLAAAVAIPVSVLGACAVIYARGDEMNSIVLLGLVLVVGMLIDNAVVIIESIQLELQRGRSAIDAARIGARRVGLATVASTMSSVIVFLPLVFGGDPGSEMSTYMVPLGTTFVAALVTSLIVSQTLLPLLTTKIFGQTVRPTRHAIMDRVGGAYAWLIQRTLRFPRLTVLVGLGLAGSAAVPSQQLRIELGDTEEAGISLPIQLQFTGSRGFETIETTVKAIEDALLPRRTELGFENLVCRFGDWHGSCDVFPAVPIEDEHEMSAFEKAIERALPEQSGLTYRLGEREPHWRRGRDPRTVTFAIRGEDMGTLMALSEDVAEHLRGRLKKGTVDDPSPGAYDAITGPFSEGNRELHVELDPDRLHRYGLDAKNVGDFVGLAFSGVNLGEVRDGEERLSLKISSGGTAENVSRQDVLDLRVPTDAGEVPLGSLGTVVIKRSPWWVQRVDRRTEVRVSVGFFVPSPGNRELVMNAVEAFPFPSGYSAGGPTPWGDPEESNALLVNLMLALVLVYAVMASLFESFLQPLGILATCLLGCVGAPWAMAITDTTVDFVAVIGLMILIGIVVNNGIMLIDLVTQLRKSGMHRTQALAQAGRERLRPILMTACTTIVGLVPMLIHHPTLAGVYYHSIAIIVAGGLATSTLMTLVFLPSVYAIIEDVSSGARRAWRRMI
jgi:HAE1 family hydrophobic/amphiphilic exporter-1